MKKVLSLILSLLMILSLFAGMSVGAAESDTADTGVSYNLWLGSTRVTDANKNDILGDGTASFDSNTNTLRLNDPTISSFYYDSKVFCGTDPYYNPIYLTCKIYASDMNLNVIGYYHMSEKGRECYGLYIQNGSVTFDGDFAFYGDHCGVYVKGNVNIVGGRFEAYCLDVYVSEVANAGISATGKIRMTSSIEYVQSTGVGAGIAFGTIELDNSITANSIADYPNYPMRQADYNHMYTGGGSDKYDGIKTFFYLDGLNISTKPVRIVRFEVRYENHRYPIWLGRMQVTDDNKNDILYDGGKAKYNSDTGTLTLDDPTILGVVPDADSKIYSKKQLTVNGEYHMTSAEKNYGILSTSDLTLDGNFTFRGLVSAVRSSTSRTSSNPTLYILNAIIEPNGGIINHDTVYGTDGKTAKNVRTGPGVTITFDANGGSGYMESVKVAKYTWYELPECAFAPPAGQEFRCWQAGTYVNPGSTINPSIDTTVKAIWRTADTNKCTVSFDANGGSGTMYNVTVNKGAFYLAPDCTFKPPYGMEFDYWTCDGVEYTGQNIRENTVLTANWKYKPISEIYCTVTEPEEGSTPAYTVGLPDNCGYEVYKYYEEFDTVDGVAWYNNTDGGWVNSFDEFKGGRSYSVTFTLNATYGRMFDTNGVTAYINGIESIVGYVTSDAVYLTGTFPELPGGEPTYVLGDVDGSGKTDIVDATIVQRYATGLKLNIPEEQIETRGDVNGSGKTDITDATFIQRYATGIPTPFDIGKAV